MTGAYPNGGSEGEVGIKEAVDRHIEWLKVHNYSASTVKSRIHHLGCFASFMESLGIVNVSEISSSGLEAFQSLLYSHRKRDGHPLTFKTQSQRLIPVKVFLTWLQCHAYSPVDLSKFIVLPKTERRLPKETLSVKEVEDILKAPDVTTPHGLRDRTILEVFWATAIRRAELKNLKVRDVDINRLTLFVDQGKGMKDRYVPLTESSAKWIERYLLCVRPRLVTRDETGILFLGKSGKPLSLDFLSIIVHRYVTAVTNKSGACHAFRHAAATAMVDNGANLRHVAEFLGHSSITTTQIYTSVSIEKLRQVHRATHPGARAQV